MLYDLFIKRKIQTPTLRHDVNNSFMCLVGTEQLPFILVYIPIKFKNYLKSVSIIKKIFFRVVQIKLIQDRCWMMIRRIKRFINNHLDSKVFRSNNINASNNNNISNTIINNENIENTNLSTNSPEQKSTFSSGIKENNNNFSKDYISQLNQNLNNNNFNLNLNSDRRI